MTGKLLWAQEKTEDGAVSVKQVGTTENSADIGTKCLPRQRLPVLMHESGLVFVSSFESVGEEEHAHHVGKAANTARLKRIAKAVFRMSVAMGLEPVVPVGAVATVPSAGAISLTCVDVDEPKQDAWWIVAMVFLFTCGLTVVMMVVSRACRSFHGRLMRVETEMGAVQSRLGEYHNFAARLDEISTRTETFEEDMTETAGTLLHTDTFTHKTVFYT